MRQWRVKDAAIAERLHQEYYSKKARWIVQVERRGKGPKVATAEARYGQATSKASRNTFTIGTAIHAK